MKQPDSHTALVLFARSAREEVCHKNLLPQLPASRQEEVFEAFNHRSLALLAATGLPYFLVSSDQQQGHTFGERLHQALAQTFARGFRQVIVVGNDCPQLSVPDLMNAAALLEKHGAVLGPDHHGGIYLLGLQKDVFEQTSGFSQVAWQTPFVAQQLKNLLQQEVTGLFCLTAYGDINTPTDFRRALRQRLFTRSLRHRLSRLVYSLLPPIPQLNFVFSPIQSHPAALFRGPPVSSKQLAVNS
ncbi:MAG: TIGR04282 family arsenosugar biosynthesis glycosyltransferase [Adhaeribacter sp.]